MDINFEICYTVSITFTRVIKLVFFLFYFLLKINFKWGLDDGKDNINVEKLKWAYTTTNI